MPGVSSLTSWETMGSSYRFPVRVPECDLRWWTFSDRLSDRTSHKAYSYASTTLTSSSVTTPSTIVYERNWKGPAASVSAVETST